MFDFVSVYLRGFEVLTVATPRDAADANFTEATKAILRTRCQDLLRYMGFTPGDLRECILYDFDGERICNL